MFIIEEFSELWRVIILKWPESTVNFYGCICDYKNFNYLFDLLPVGQLVCGLVSYSNYFVLNVDATNCFLIPDEIFPLNMFLLLMFDNLIFDLIDDIVA